MQSSRSSFHAYENKESKHPKKDPVQSIFSGIFSYSWKSSRMCSASLVAAPLCTGLASASLKTGASDSQQSAAEGDADPELSLWFYWRSFSPRVQASTARQCIRINRCYQHQQQIIFLGFVISGEQQVAASQFTLRMEREGSRGYIGISKPFSEGKRSSELELDKYIVKEAIICAPILLLVRYTANQRWGIWRFHTWRGFVLYTQVKKIPKTESMCTCM